MWFALCLATTSAEQLCVNVSQCGVIANCRLETYHILLWKFGIFWKYASVYFPGIINEKWILLWYCWEYDPFLNYFLNIKLDANCLMRSLSDRSISKSIARVKCQTLTDTSQLHFLWKTASWGLMSEHRNRLHPNPFLTHHNSVDLTTRNKILPL